MSVDVLGQLRTGDVALRPQERRLLCALVLGRGEKVAAGDIADACWGDERPSTWWQQIKTSITRLRRALGPEVARTVSGGYAFGWEPATIDAVIFEDLVIRARGELDRSELDRAGHSLSAALALWRGPPFEDVTDWMPAVIERDRLLEIRAAAEEDLLSVRLRSGAAVDVLPDAERLVRQAPLRESRWEILALANYQARRQVEALAVLREGRVRLLEELGLEPGPRHRALEAAILRHDPSLDPPAVLLGASGRCPYPGLRSFDRDDADLFFGREEEVAILTERLRAGRVLTVTGPSGSGKSSLVRAGLIPRAIAGGGSAIVLRPSADAAAALASWRPPATRALGLIVIDQFEEFWTLDAAENSTVGDAMVAALEQGAAIVVIVRSDFLDEATALPRIGERIGRDVFAVGPLTSHAVRRVVEEPADRAGLRIEPGLTELVLRDGGDRAAALSYLAHALSETWVRRRGVTLTVAAYSETGGIRGAIGQSAERLYDVLSDSDRAVCRSLMLRLVQRTDDGASIRRTVEVGPLIGDPRRRRVIEALVAARLVAVDGPSMTIAHEAIAEAWPRLDRWLRDDVEDDKRLRELQTSAARWVASGRVADELVRGARLHAYLAWRETTSPELTSDEAAFLDAGQANEQGELASIRARAASDHRRLRATRFALTGAAALLVVAIVAGGLAFARERDARAAETVARTAAVASTARSLLGSDRDLAALLAAELHRRDATDVVARSALLTVLSAPATPTATVVFGDGEAVSAAPIPGTTDALVIVEPAEGVARPRLEVWDLARGERKRRVDAALPINETQAERQLFVQPDGRRAVVVTPVWWNDFAGDCCLSTLATVDLATGSVSVAPRPLGLRTGPSAAAVAGGDALVLVDAYSGEPIWLDPDELTVDTDAVSQGYDWGPTVSTAITEVGDGAIAIGEPEGDGAAVIRMYDTTTHAVTRSVPLAADVVSTSMVSVDGGSILSAGPQGIALIDVESGDVVWRQRPVDDRPCAHLVVIDADSAVCGASASWEFRISDGAPTGRSFDSQAAWFTGLAPLADGSLLTVNLKDPALLQRFPLDGTGPISRLIARDRHVAGDFLDGESILVASDPRNGAAPAESVVRWNIDADRAEERRPGDVVVVSQGVARLWSADVAATVLEDVRASGSWRITGDFDVPGDQLVPVDGGAGGRSFAIADDWIVPFDPVTGRTTGPPMDFRGKQLHWRWVMVHEIPNSERAIVTWWDRDDSALQTAVFDLTTGVEVARGLAGDVASMPLTDGRIVSANFSRLQVSTSDLDPISVVPRPGNFGNVLELSDDGATLLIQAQGGGAALYDVASMTKLGEDFDLVSPDWESAHLSPDGLTLVTNSPAGVLVWDLASSTLAAAACEVAGRRLTPTEWSTYFPEDPYVDACEGSVRQGMTGHTR